MLNVMMMMVLMMMVHGSDHNNTDDDNSNRLEVVGHIAHRVCSSSSAGEAVWHGRDGGVFGGHDPEGSTHCTRGHHRHVE